MRKVEMIREVRDVMSGISSDRFCIFGKDHLGNWQVTSRNSCRYDTDEVNWAEVGIANHVCNYISINEITSYVNEKLKEGRR